jgi:hypothetical protein
LSSSDKIRDLLDIRTTMSAEKAQKLILEGKLPRNVTVDGGFVVVWYENHLTRNHV